MEHGYGIIALQKREGVWYVFIVLRDKGFWEYPKGHADSNEEPWQAAIRELQEETGLKVTSRLDFSPMQIHYQVEKTPKTVTYFLAEVEGQIELQPEEVKDGKWVPLNEAKDILTYENSKRLTDEVIQHLL